MWLQHINFVSALWIQQFKYKLSLSIGHLFDQDTHVMSPWLHVCTIFASSWSVKILAAMRPCKTMSVCTGCKSSGKSEYSQWSSLWVRGASTTFLLSRAFVALFCELAASSLSSGPVNKANSVTSCDSYCNYWLLKMSLTSM